jgi:hypothetical protein
VKQAPDRRLHSIALVSNEQAESFFSRLDRLVSAVRAYCVVVVVVVVAAAGLLEPLEVDAATATATTATAAATMPAVMPPAAAPVAAFAPPDVPLAGVCASALPAKNTDVITMASAFFIFISCDKTPASDSGRAFLNAAPTAQLLSVLRCCCGCLTIRTKLVADELCKGRAIRQASCQILING